MAQYSFGCSKLSFLEKIVKAICGDSVAGVTKYLLINYVSINKMIPWKFESLTMEICSFVLFK